VLYAAQARGALKVVACAEPAQGGIYVGMPVAEASALARSRGKSRATRRKTSGAEPDLPAMFHRYEPLADRRALEELAGWCEQFSPLVGLEDSTAPESAAPESLLLDVTGLAGLFHGEAALVEQVVRQFDARGLGVRVALADSVGAAWALAHYGFDCEDSLEDAEKSQLAGSRSLLAPAGEGARPLASLPVDALRLTAETLARLAELGIHRIDQLQALSRCGLATRFGPEIVRRLDQALGQAEEVISPPRLAPSWEADWSLEHPTDRQDVLAAAIGEQLEKLLEKLVSRSEGIQKLICRLQSEQGTTTDLTLGLFRPSVRLKHVMELIKLRLENIRLEQPIVRLQLSITATAPLEYEQRELFEEISSCTASSQDSLRQLAGLIDRLTSRLGGDSVLRTRSWPDPQPEYAWRYEPWIQTPRATSAKAERKKSLPAVEDKKRLRLERPLRLAHRPIPLAVISVVPASLAVDGLPLYFRLGHEEHRIARHWGPERIETGWWRGRLARRDYYRVETSTGERYWLFRQLQDGQWFLHGWFD
jgi:protein ImuB